MAYIDDVKRSLLHRKISSSDQLRINKGVMEVIGASVSVAKFKEFKQFLRANKVLIVKGQWT